MLPFTISIVSTSGHFSFCKKLQKCDLLLLLHEMKNVIEALIAFFFVLKGKEKVSIWIQQYKQGTLSSAHVNWYPTES